MLKNHNNLLGHFSLHHARWERDALDCNCSTKNKPRLPPALSTVMSWTNWCSVQALSCVLAVIISLPISNTGSQSPNTLNPSCYPFPTSKPDSHRTGLNPWNDHCCALPLESWLTRHSTIFEAHIPVKLPSVNWVITDIHLPGSKILATSRGTEFLPSFYSPLSQLQYVPFHSWSFVLSVHWAPTPSHNWDLSTNSHSLGPDILGTRITTTWCINHQRPAAPHIL